MSGSATDYAVPKSITVQSGVPTPLSDFFTETSTSPGVGAAFPFAPPGGGVSNPGVVNFFAANGVPGEFSENISPEQVGTTVVSATFGDPALDSPPVPAADQVSVTLTDLPGVSGTQTVPVGELFLGGISGNNQNVLFNSPAVITIQPSGSTTNPPPPPPPPTSVTTLAGVHPILANDEATLANATSTQAKSVLAGIKDFDNFITTVSADGLLPGTNLASTLVSINSLILDSIQFIKSPTQTNANEFASQLGSTTGNILGNVLAAPVAELATVAGGPALGALVLKTASVLGQGIGFAVAAGEIALVNTEFNAGISVLGGLQNFEFAINTGSSVSQAFRSGVSTAFTDFIQHQ